MATVEVRTDRTGFPMIQIDLDSGPVYLHWLPVTKVQFECFLCDQPSTQFNEDWYTKMLGINARISPREIQSGNFWKALMTGVRPEEAKLFADWSSQQSDDIEYSLPTAELWRKCYLAVSKRDAIDPAEVLGKLTPKSRAAVIVKNMAEMVAAQKGIGKSTLADQMLLRRGVMEWVHWPGQKHGDWGLWGAPNKALQPDIRDLDKQDRPEPARADDARFPVRGFRLVRREVG